LAALSFLAQFPRMAYEEKIVTTTFDGYVIYAARTARLIPDIF
jgi:protein-S-isoprenylcysteine O-methyltransferase Ste14